MIFGAQEIVVKPYDKTWVLVQKTAFDYFMNQFNEYKIKYERLVEVRESERKDWLMERSILKDALDLANKKNEIYEQEVLRLNSAINSIVSKGKVKDAVLIASLLGNIINAFR